MVEAWGPGEGGGILWVGLGEEGWGRPGQAARTPCKLCMPPPPLPPLPILPLPGRTYKMSTQKTFPFKMSPHESPLGSDFTKFSYPDPDQGLEFGPLLFQVQSNMYILFFPKTVEDTTVYCTINMIRIFVDFPSDLIRSDSDRGILGTIEMIKQWVS